MRSPILYRLRCHTPTASRTPARFSRRADAQRRDKVQSCQAFFYFPHSYLQRRANGTHVDCSRSTTGFVQRKGRRCIRQRRTHVPAEDARKMQLERACVSVATSLQPIRQDSRIPVVRCTAAQSRLPATETPQNRVTCGLTARRVPANHKLRPWATERIGRYRDASYVA